MARFNLPDNAWADLRDPKKIPERLRRPIRLSALALQRTLPEDELKRLQTSVKVDELKAPEASEDVRSAFGTPPVESLAEEVGVTPEPLKTEDESIVLPTDEQQNAADVYNVALITGYVSAWSYGVDITAEAAENLPGDAYDALLEEVRRLNEDESEESLAEDPSSP